MYYIYRGQSVSRKSRERAANFPKVFRFSRDATRCTNSFRSTRGCTRLSLGSFVRSFVSREVRATSGSVTRSLFRVSRKGPPSVQLDPTLATRSTSTGTTRLSSRRRHRGGALRRTPPLVQPLPFATCRRPVRERILACLRHFSRKRLAGAASRPLLPASFSADLIEPRTTHTTQTHTYITFHYCDRFMRAGKRGRARPGSPPTRRVHPRNTVRLTC